MDYKKKYKDALGWMQSIYPTMTGADKEDAEHFFPELKESEGERIREGLLYVIEHHPTLPTEEAEEYIAWLKKKTR